MPQKKRESFTTDRLFAKLLELQLLRHVKNAENCFLNCRKFELELSTMSSNARYLFMYGPQKKIVEMEVEGDGANLQQLKAKACVLFGLPDVAMQSWDKGFEEWADCEEDDIVPTNTKLLVREVLSDLNDSTTSTCSSVEDTSDSDSTRNCPESASSSTAKLPGPSKKDTELLTKMSSHSWHLGYQLPTFSSSIEDKLQNGQLLKEAERSAVLESLYNSVKIHTYYPKTAQYDSIIRQLSNAYPKSFNQPNMTMNDAMTLWRHRLQYKFANARKREDNAMPAVRSRKRKTTHMDSESPAKRPPPQWGMANYLPPRPASEDDASIIAHIEWMQQEKLRKKPHYERVTISMKATLADRRVFIVKEGASVKQVKERYPWLFEEEEVFLEFQRLEGTSSVEDLLSEGLEKYATPILECTKALKKRPHLVDTALADISSHKEENVRKVYSKRAAVLSVPGLLGEKVDNLLVSGEADDRELPVFIRADEKDDTVVYTVVVDGLEVTTSTQFLSAFASFLAVFYCFNLVYTASIRKTLQFYQRVVLNIQDNLPIDKSVVKVLEKLNMKI